MIVNFLICPYLLKISFQENFIFYSVVITTGKKMTVLQFISTDRADTFMTYTNWVSG